MDYSTLNISELYNMLSDEEKVIIGYFESYPVNNHEIFKLLKIKEVYYMNFGNLSATDFFDKAISLQLNEDLETAKKQKSNDLTKKIATLNAFKNPIVWAVRHNRKAFAWYLAKKNFCQAVDPSQIFPQLINDNSDFIKILSFIPLTIANQKNEFALYGILRRILNQPEQEDMLLNVYYSLKKAKYCDINQPTNYYWQNYVYGSNKKGDTHLRYAKDHLQTRLLHEGLVESPKILPLLLKFKDLDVNISNDQSKNSPIMQLLRWADVLHMCEQMKMVKVGLASIENLCLPEVMQQVLEKYDVEKSNKYIDLFIKLGAKLDYKNRDNETVVMTAIHHHHNHGVEVCKELLYPEILQDMAKLNGRSCWSELSPEICNILSTKFPTMLDSTGTTYSQYLSNQDFYDKQCRKRRKMPYRDLAKFIKLYNFVDYYNINKASAIYVMLNGIYGENCKEGMEYDNKLGQILIKYNLEKILDGSSFEFGDFISNLQNSPKISDTSIQNFLKEYTYFVEDELVKLKIAVETKLASNSNSNCLRYKEWIKEGEEKTSGYADKIDEISGKNENSLT